MKILALNGSYRRNGNTEILLKQALMAAEKEGAAVELVKLTDYEIKACRGCGLCLFKKDYCQVKDDDVRILFEKIKECDGLILGAPCYFLETTAVIKQLVDRCWVLGHQLDKPRKPASVIIPFATQGWIPYIMVQPNILLKLLGMEKIDQYAVHTQGISEVLLDDEAMVRAYRMGREMVRAVKTGDYSYRGRPGLCPVCHDNILRVLDDQETVECPVCAIRGKIEIVNNKIMVHFSERDIAKPRFGVEDSYNHFTYHIKPSKEFFIRTKGERKERVQVFKEYLNT